MKRMMIVGIIAVVVIVIGVGAFFAGSAYGQQQAQNIRADFFRARQGGSDGQGGVNGTPSQPGQNGQVGQSAPAAFGTVKSVTGNTIVLTAQDGSTVTVTVNAQTTFQNTVSGSISDVQPGQRITVSSDQTGNNIVARAIQVRPAAAQQ